MSSREWALDEINRAKVTADAYTTACLDSAMKVFDCLNEEGHSGISIHYTKDIINRLISGKPLTPIKDEASDWAEIECYDGEQNTYHCLRQPGLYKHITNNKSTYIDHNRFVGENIYDGSLFYSDLISKIGHELKPIRMPYMSSDKPYKITVKEFLYDPDNGDFDTMHVINLIDPQGDKTKINRYFRMSNFGEKEDYKGWVELSYMEYEDRYKNRIK